MDSVGLPPIDTTMDDIRRLVTMNPLAAEQLARIGRERQMEELLKQLKEAHDLLKAGEEGNQNGQ